MAKRRFLVEISGEAIIELDDAVIDVVDDEWRSVFYELRTPEEIAEHVAHNLIVNKWSLSSLDGWADQPDGNAKLVGDVYWGDWHVTEIEADNGEGEGHGD